MQGLRIWAAALLLYGGFALWYDNWRGPLRPEEIDHLLELARVQSSIEPERLAHVRAFLEADDGGEFFMLNLLRLAPDPVATPGSGALAPAAELLDGYTRHFMPALFRRAGHPALLGRAAGRYVEQWGVEPDPGWTASGVIRYRSRRDLMELATDPRFESAHEFKRIAIANTLAFPLSPAMLTFGPRVVVALALALIAALGNLALARLRPKRP